MSEEENVGISNQFLMQIFPLRMKPSQHSEQVLDTSKGISVYYVPTLSNFLLSSNMYYLIDENSNLLLTSQYNKSSDTSTQSDIPIIPS